MCNLINLLSTNISKNILSFLFFISLCFNSIHANASTSNEKPILTVYTYSSFVSEWGPANKIKSQFETICHCEVKFVALSDGVVLLNRLKLEGNKTEADVILGLDNNLIASAKQSQLVQPYHFTPSSLNIDWHDDYFIPYDHSYFAFIYDRNQVKNPPHSMAELLEPNNSWQIVYQDPRTSTPGLGLLLWMKKIYGDNVDSAWALLNKKTLTVTKGWSESYKMMLKNQVDFVLSYSTSPAVHLMNNEDHYEAARFDEGHYQQIEVAAITKNSQQVELANDFLQFLLTPEIQIIIATTNIMYPVIDVTLPDAFSSLIEVKPLMFSAEEVDQNRQQWIRSWQNVISQ